MLRFLFSLIAFFCLLLPLISAFPAIYSDDELADENNGYRYFQDKRGLVIPSNALMLRNYPILRRV